jgi:hypothetical protein
LYWWFRLSDHSINNWYSIDTESLANEWKKNFWRVFTRIEDY